MNPNEENGLLFNRRSSAQPGSTHLAENIEIAANAVIAFDAQGKITFWNPAAERMYGWTTDEVLGKSADELFWPLETAQEREEHKKRQIELDSSGILHGEYRVRRKDGSYFSVEYTNHARFDAQGGVLDYVAMYRDITEYKQTIEELRQNQLFTEFVGKVTPDILFIFDLEDNRTVYTNGRIQSILGHTDEQVAALLGINTSLLHPDDLTHVPVLVGEVPYRLEGQIIEGEYRIRATDDTYRWLRVRSTVFKRTPEGRPKQMIGAATDITEHKRFEHEIKIAAKMPAENPNPVMRITLDGQVVYANHACGSLLEFWRRTTGHTISDEVRRGIREAFETGSTKVLEVEYEGKTLTCTLAPIQESGYINFYGNDITERKRAEEKLRQARAAAERAMERVARLQNVTAALSEALTTAEVARIVIEQGIPALSATSGTIILLSKDKLMLEIVHTSSPEAVHRPYRRFPISLHVPAADAVRFGTPIWISSRQEYKDRYPHLTEQIEIWGLQAAGSIPLLVKDHKLGVLTLSFDQVREFTSEDKDFALTLAQQCAQALERAELYQQTRQALSELQMTYDQSPIGMIQLDTDLRYIRVNETLALYNGIPAADHIGKSIWEIVPDLTPKIEEGFRRVIETGEPVFNLEVVGETKAEPGVPHTWLESWYPMREKDGKVVGLNIVVQDITNRKKDERALAEFARQQEALFKLADQLHRTSSLKATFDAALDAILYALQCDRASILLFDETGKMRFVAWRGLSANYRQATDGHSPWKPDEKDPLPIYFNDIDDAELDNTLKAILKAEGIASLAFIPLVSEGKLIGKFMTYFDTPHAFNVNEMDLSLTIAHQLAFGIQRRRAEEALHASEALYRAIARSIPDGGVFVVDKDLRYLVAEGIVLTNYELSQEMLEGHTVSEVFNEEVGARMSERFQRNFAGETIRFETRRNGRVYWTQQAPLLDSTGHAIGITIDITERKQAEEALRESKKQLQILNESLEQKVREQTTEVRKLASDLTMAEQRERHRIAHILHDDLQQRLHAIRMQVEFLLGEVEGDNAALQMDFEEIRKQLNEAVAVTRHLSVDLSPPILRDEGLTEAIEWLASQMHQKYGLEVELRSSGPFHIQNENVQMLLFNCVRELLFNVVKHAGIDRVVVTLQKMDNAVRVEVRDEGKGFEWYELASHASHNAHEDGLQQRSFGLPTIRHRLSLFGGRMDIRTKPGAGTLVVITVPLEQESQNFSDEA